MTATSMIWRDAEKRKQAARTETTPATLCARLQAAAIKCDDYHVFVSYAPHVGALSIVVRNSDHEYAAAAAHWPEPILDEYVYIDSADSLEELTALADQLQRLGIHV